jgi:hypothetical protein
MTTQWENGPFNTKEEALSAAGVKPAPTLQERLRECGAITFSTSGWELSKRLMLEAADELDRLTALCSRLARNWADSAREADRLRRLREQKAELVKALRYCAADPCTLHPANNAQHVVAQNCLNALAADEKDRRNG